MAYTVIAFLVFMTCINAKPTPTKFSYNDIDYSGHIKAVEFV